MSAEKQKKRSPERKGEAPENASAPAVKRKVTRVDVARRAGVSEATVSYVLSKKRHVSAELTERVNQAVRELDYIPDMIASSMIVKKSRTIGILTEDIANPLYTTVFKGIQRAADRRGYFVNICNGTGNSGHIMKDFIRRKMDGVFISVTATDTINAYLKRLCDRGISVVYNMVHGLCDDRICGIDLDMKDGMRQIMTYLAGLGHKKIVYLSAFDRAYVQDDRLRGFLEAAEKLGLDEAWVDEGKPPYPSTVESGAAQTEALLAQGKPFTALVCTNDLMAYGAMQTLRKRGLRIPEEVSVVGIDNIFYSPLTNPPLTTLDHGGEDYGERLFEILFENMTTGGIRREYFRTRLIVRDSCAKVRGESGESR